MKSKSGVCCYCGNSCQITDEHVVPKGLYLKDHRITIPCCEDCNNGKAKDDEYFRLVFAVLKESEDHETAKEIIKKS